MKAGRRPKRRIAGIPHAWDYTNSFGTHTRSHEELAYDWLQVAGVLAQSDDPEARAKGKARLRQAARILAQAEAATWKRRAGAKLDRPRAKDPLRAKVLDLMKTYRDSELKTFLEAWEAEALHGVRLTWMPTEDSYQVADENGDAGTKNYKLATLTTMFSESKAS